MDYEKKYKEALERAKTLYENANGMILKKWVEQVFPELAESEDERIRKALLEYFGEECDTATINGIYCYKIYDWLEKQAPKPKWTEEDIIRLDRICKTLWKNRNGDTDEIYQQEQDVDWLKSLKQRMGGEE